MAVVSGDSYGVGCDLVFSYPVVTFQGRWNKVADLDMCERSAKMIEATKKELMEERDAVKDLMGN